MEAIRCQNCHHYYHADQIEEHRNLHYNPTELRPKTQHHNMKRMEYSSAVHFDSGSDTTDVALRSLLPEEIPRDQREKQRVGLPENDDNFGNDGNNGYGQGQGGSDAAKYRNYRNRDKLDLNSNLANNSLSNRDQLNKLNIEKQVDLKTVKTQVPRKQIRKYQNDPYSAKQIRDLGGCEKKVPNRGPENNEGEGQGYRIGSNDPNNGDGKDRSGYNGGQGDNKGRNGDNFDGENESGYKVMRDNTYQKNSAKKEAIYVPINRRTADPNEYKMVDTRLNGDNARRGRRGEQGSEENDDLKKGRSGYNDGPQDNSRVQPYPGDRRYPREGDDGRNPREGEDRGYPREGEGDRERDRRYPREGEDKEDNRDRGYPRQDDNRYVKEGDGDRRYPREGYGYGVRPKDQNDYHDHGVHHHECPDCHGFYCRTCGATIPPQYRPFWDEDESPQMIEFYKKRIRAQRDRQRKMRGECKYCSHPSSSKYEDKEKVKE